MRENSSERSRRYIEMTSDSLRRLKTLRLLEKISKGQLDDVLETVRDYVKDAEHYLEKRKPVTSLSCVAYAEGLLDALKLLGLVEF